MRTRIAALAVAAGVAGAVAAAVSPAGAVTGGAKVGPNQEFTALVNRHAGQPQPVTIMMACFGPIRPGQTGHPVAGQTVEVTRATTTGTDVGFTGSAATAIGAFFGAPPPVAALARRAPSYLTLTTYGVAKRIPTTLNLPCAGTGQVTFVPLPMSPPTSRAAVVPVSFVGQP